MAVGSFDISNAFNELSRAAMSDAIKTHKPSWWRLARWIYGTPNKLFLSTPAGQAILWSAQGVRQGDPFGRYFFSIALKTPIANLYDLHSDRMPELYLYFDDITGIFTRNAEETYAMIIEEWNTTVD